MNFTKKINCNLILILLFAVLLALHLPFLNADPYQLADKNTRGAFTDEGLYSQQARNYINYCDIPNERSTFIIAPLQQFIYTPIFAVFGEKLLPIRLFSLVLLILTLALLAFYSKLKSLSLFAVFIVFFEFHVFHFSHYAMAEILYSSSLLIALAFFVRYYEIKSMKNAFLSGFFVFISYAFKINSIYFTAIIPLASFIIEFSNFFTSQKRIKALKRVLMFALINLGFLLLYIIVWYFPNNEFIDMIISERGMSIFNIGIIESVKLTYFNHIGLFESKLFRYTFLITIFLIPFAFKRFNHKEKVIFWFLVASLILESHKLLMHSYLPVRYMLSSLIIVGLFISLILSTLFREKLAWKILVSLILLSNISFNTFMYIKSLNERTYHMKNLNEYLLKYDLSEKEIYGSWAATATWGSGVRIKSVWNDEINKSEIEDLSADIVLSELDESDSNEFYKKNGINLIEISDSVRVFNIGKYKLGVFWISKN